MEFADQSLQVSSDRSPFSLTKAMSMRSSHFFVTLIACACLIGTTVSFQSNSAELNAPVIDAFGEGGAVFVVRQSGNDVVLSSYKPENSAALPEKSRSVIPGVSSRSVVSAVGTVDVLPEKRFAASRLHGMSCVAQSQKSPLATGRKR